MKRKIFLILLLLCMIFSSGCSAETVAQADLISMDTVIRLQIYGTNAQTALDNCLHTLSELEARFADVGVESEVARLNQANGAETEVSPLLFEMLQCAKSISVELPDTLDLTIVPLTALWGFSGNASMHLPQETQIMELLPTVGMNFLELCVERQTVTLHSGATITLGAIAKGLIGRELAAQLEQDPGVTHAYLSLGGNVQLVKNKTDAMPWKIGLANPYAHSELLGVFTLDSPCAVVTSGTYQRNFTENGTVYHHILYPKTGYPVENGMRSVTVLCQDGMRADALSTALFVAGMEQAIAYYRMHSGFEFVCVTEAQEIFVSEGIAEKFSVISSDEIVHVVQRNPDSE